jgi:hypothetical protein
MLAIFAAAAAAAASSTAAPPPPAVAQAVDAVQVTATRPVVGTLQQGIQAYRPDFFTPVRPGTAFDMVQWLPGFVFEDMRDLRGLAGSAGNVLIDGQPPTSKNETLAMVLRRIPATQVERVDIVVGGAPGVDMRGRSVIANVVLKKGATPLGSITASTQVYQRGPIVPELQLALVRKRGERTAEGSLTLARRRIQGAGPGRGPLIRTDPDGNVLFAAESEIAGTLPYGAVSGAYQFPWAGGKLKLSASGNFQDVDAAEAAEVAGSADLYRIHEKEHYRQGEVGARYERSFGRVNLESQFLQRVNGHEHQTDTFRPPVVSSLDENDTSTETVARSTLRFNQSPKLTLEASAEGALNRLETDSTFTSGGVAIVVPAADVVVSERRGELGTLASWKPSKAFSLTTALKLEASNLTADGDLDTERSLTYLKPRLVVSWSPDSRTQLRLRGEHEVNQIRFQNFIANVDSLTGQVRAGNPNIRPQRAWVAEAVIERQFWTGASLVFTARRSELRDVVDLLPLAAFGGATAIGNIGDGVQTDLATTLTLPLKRLGLDGMNLKGTVTRRRSEVTDPTTGDPRRISGQSEWVGDAHFSHDLPRWKLTWGVDLTYGSDTSIYQPTVIERVGAAARLSAFIEYRLRPDLNLRLEAFNLTDTKVKLVVDSYAGLRSTAPLAYSELRKPGDGPYLFFRVRKTLK